MAFSVVAKAEALRDELSNLLGSTDAFGDPDLQGANQCLLAAACSQSTDLSGPAQGLSTASAEVANVLVALVHGCSATLMNNADQFFDLFKLVKRMGISSCMELCQEVVNKGGYNDGSVELRLSVQQTEAIRSKLSQWRTAQVPEWTDVAMRVRGEEAAPTRAHSILLVAHCEYFRALWAGNFKEKAGAAEISLEDATEAKLAEMLVQIIYGNTVQVSTEEELVHLFCLADRWQCSSVCSAALQALEAQDAMVATVAVDILGWERPAPEQLTQAAVRAIRKSQREGDLTVQNMPLLAACRLLRTIGSSCNDLVLVDTVQERILSGLCSERVPKLPLTQISEKLMKSSLQQGSAGQKLLAARPISLLNLADWAKEVDASVDIANGGRAFTRVANLLWSGAPDSIQSILRQTIVLMIDGFEDGPSSACCDLIHGVVSTCAEAESTAAISKGAERDTKRRKVIDRKLKDMKSILTGLEAYVHNLILRSAMHWAAEHALQIMRCKEWTELEPEVFVKIAAALLNVQDNLDEIAVGEKVLRKGQEAVIIKVDQSLIPPSYVVRMVADGKEVDTERKLLQKCPESQDAIDLNASASAGREHETDCLSKKNQVKSGIADWARKASVPAFTEAIRLTGNDKGSEALFRLLVDGAQVRWEDAERQNAVLQGGRHQEELAAAVSAAKADVEAKLRGELGAVLAAFRQDLTDVHQRQVLQVEDIHKRLLCVSADELQPKVHKTPCAGED